MILSTNKKQPQLLVCTQKRSGPDPECCAKNGSESLLLELGKAAAEAGVTIELIEIKCMLLCEKGPNVRLNPISKMWNKVSTQDIPEILTVCKK